MTVRLNFRASLQLRAVARTLVRWRTQAELTGVEVSQRAGFSQTKLSKMENAAQDISPADLMLLAVIYGVKPAERERVFNAAVRAKDPDLWDRMVGDTKPCVQVQPHDLLAEAGSLRMVGTEAIPAILRTPLYDAALSSLRPVSDTVSRRDLELTERLRKRMYDTPPLRVHAVLGEAALLRPVGGPQVLAEQLMRLLELNELPWVRIQVVPLSSPDGASLSAVPAFTLTSFPEERFDDVVLIEQLHTETWVEGLDNVQPYEVAFGKLAALARNSTGSVELIADLITTHQQGIAARVTGAEPVTERHPTAAVKATGDGHPVTRPTRHSTGLRWWGRSGSRHENQ